MTSGLDSSDPISSDRSTRCRNLSAIDSFKTLCLCGGRNVAKDMLSN